MVVSMAKSTTSTDEHHTSCLLPPPLPPLCALRRVFVQSACDFPEVGASLGLATLAEYVPEPQQNAVSTAAKLGHFRLMSLGVGSKQLAQMCRQLPPESAP